MDARAAEGGRRASLEASRSHALECFEQDERELTASVSIAVQDDAFAFTPPVSPTSGSFIKPGSYRYLKGGKSTCTTH